MSELEREQLLKPVKRWTDCKKRAIINGCRNRLITPLEARLMHGISVEEFTLWFLIEETDLHKRRNRRRPRPPTMSAAECQLVKAPRVSPRRLIEEARARRAA